MFAKVSISAPSDVTQQMPQVIPQWSQDYNIMKVTGLFPSVYHVSLEFRVMSMEGFGRSILRFVNKLMILEGSSKKPLPADTARLEIASCSVFGQ